MDILDRNFNAYSITYMGNMDFNILNNKVSHNSTFILKKNLLHILIQELPLEELNNLIYTKIFYIGEQYETN